MRFASSHCESNASKYVIKIKSNYSIVVNGKVTGINTTRTPHRSEAISPSPLADVTVDGAASVEINRTLTYINMCFRCSSGRQLGSDGRSCSINSTLTWLLCSRGPLSLSLSGPYGSRTEQAKFSSDDVHLCCKLLNDSFFFVFFCRELNCSSGHANIMISSIFIYIILIQ